MLKIKDVMTREVLCACAGTTIREVAEKMRNLDIGSLPICEDGHVAGVITDRDITIRVTAEGRDPDRTCVREVMTTEVVTCGEDEKVSVAEDLMRENQVRRLPVLDREGRISGYVTLSAVARQEDDQAVGRVLKGISEPSHVEPRGRGSIFDR